jgi:hypothetical protein
MVMEGVSGRCRGEAASGPTFNLKALMIDIASPQRPQIATGAETTRALTRLRN